MSAFLRLLDRQVAFFDGAMGTSIHSCNLPLADYNHLENCSEVLNLTRPDVIQKIHQSFLAVGSDVVESNTFGAMPHVLCEFGLEARCREINRVSVAIARRACKEQEQIDSRQRFVAGSIGPGTKLVTLGQISFDQMVESYLEQIRGLIEGGAGVGCDLLLVETCQDLLQIKAVCTAAAEAQREAGLWGTSGEIPIFASVTIETTGAMLLGSDIATAAVSLARLPIRGLGLNCATGPKEMTEHVRYLSEHWQGYLSVIPNAGLPVLLDGQAHFPLTPESLAEQLAQFARQFGVNALGGCCGTTPRHLEMLVQAVGRVAPAPRQVDEPPSCASLYNAVELRQENSVLMVGERTNANGSRKFKQLLASDDFDGLVSMAKEEVRGGAHVLDVCVDYVGRDGVKDIMEVVSRYVQQVSVPLMIDSTEAPVLEAALKLAGGKCIVNSINLEDGEERLNRVCPLLRRYGAAVVALTIDEDRLAGMAKTAQRKLEIALRLHGLCTQKWGIAESDILFDPLTFTIATGNEEDRRLGLETLEGIALIAKALPRCGILLGLSNISFGLKPEPRQVLNSVFLHEAKARGLTAAILHPSRILPEHKIPAEHWQAALDLIYDRRVEGRDPLLHYIGLFPDEEKAAPRAPQEQQTIEEILANHIIDGQKVDLETHLEQALEKYPPLTIINEHLLGGMKVVGELFGSGQMQLPFVLQSAEVMKKAVAYLEPRMEKLAGQSRGKLVLATVKGDVHDIGKNLVDIIVSNNGYQVVNLGIKQPLQQILQACREHQADAIGMSGLLVKSVGVMRENLEQMSQEGWKVPVMVGGAALTRHYAETELRKTYGSGKLYYGRDAFEALAIIAAVVEGKTAELDQAMAARLQKRAQAEQRIAQSAQAKAAGQDSASPAAVATLEAQSGPAAPVQRDLPVPQPPFWGTRVVETVPLQEIFPYVNKIALFRGQWGLRKGARSDVDYERLLEDEAEPVFRRLSQQCAGEGLLLPKVVYGYFPCNSQGEELIVYDPVQPDRELERFAFPRQAGRQRLCIADFFRSVDSGTKDVLGLSCVTMGKAASARAQQLFANNQYQEYLYLHGLSVESAEALAELWHKRMRQELGIGGDDSPHIRELFTQKYRGSRYSFGYPACPEMSDQEKLFRLLGPERIGCALTENWQIDPEQSTSAIVVHHPQARYFAV